MKEIIVDGITYVCEQKVVEPVIHSSSNTLLRGLQEGLIVFLALLVILGLIIGYKTLCDYKRDKKTTGGNKNGNSKRL